MTTDDLIVRLPRSHVSSSDAPITLHEGGRDPGQSGLYKPTGFWFEVDGDWQRWCRSDQWTTGWGHIHSVDLADCNVLTIDTVEKLDAFHTRFGVRPPWHRPGHDVGRDLMPDWGTIGLLYDGVEIAPYRWERRLDWMWYYGWDCASGVIWRPRGATVTYHGPLPDIGVEHPEIEEFIVASLGIAGED